MMDRAAVLIDVNHAQSASSMLPRPITTQFFPATFSHAPEFQGGPMQARILVTTRRHTSSAGTESFTSSALFTHSFSASTSSFARAAHSFGLFFSK